MAEPATGTKIVRRNGAATAWEIGADICVVGAGIAGVSAALEAARLGRKVVLVDSLPALGGQAVNSIIGTFCGLFSNGTHGYQFTHGIADDILRDLGAQENALHYRHGPHTTSSTTTRSRSGAGSKKPCEKPGVTLLLGAVLRARERRRPPRAIARVRDALRRRDGDSHRLSSTRRGDAALTWQAGFACREPPTRTASTARRWWCSKTSTRAAPPRARASLRS